MTIAKPNKKQKMKNKIAKQNVATRRDICCGLVVVPGKGCGLRVRCGILQLTDVGLLSVHILFRTTKNCLSIMTFTICLSVVIVTWGFVSLRGDRTPSFEEVWRPSQYLPNRQARSVHIPVSSR